MANFVLQPNDNVISDHIRRSGFDKVDFQNFSRFSASNGTRSPGRQSLSETSSSSDSNFTMVIIGFRKTPNESNDTCGLGHSGIL
jgi:hypothetical protein